MPEEPTCPRRALKAIIEGLEQIKEEVERAGYSSTLQTLELAIANARRELEQLPETRH